MAMGSVHTLRMAGRPAANASLHPLQSTSLLVADGAMLPVYPEACARE
jgi:hypothetical protein